MRNDDKVCMDRCISLLQRSVFLKSIVTLNSIQYVLPFSEMSKPMSRPSIPNDPRSFTGCVEADQQRESVVISVVQDFRFLRV